ncbi:MAG TPA: LysR family transcriptional regulator, partial [bacterium]|nr:LysR family transcriptional regulator [bacterium]
MEYVLLRERLHVFREVLASGGITSAARRLHVSQPAVSARIRELERELAVRLFSREGGGLVLTDAGRILADYASRLADVEQDALRALAELAGVQAGRLAVGASETPGHYLLIGTLGRYRALHPGVALDVLVANSATVAQRVKDGALDLGFVEGNVDDPALRRRRFRDDRLRLVVAPS